MYVFKDPAFFPVAVVQPRSIGLPRHGVTQWQIDSGRAALPLKHRITAARAACVINCQPIDREKTLYTFYECIS
ncbi:MAG: hypothetical protein DID90_2727553567 [Candidatus Nitrotoga sp. LAW]|nr:MAG: hypothetical protein DID90_2727553567 [Candidatus Nitrotoga sp. LAW]